MANGVANNDNYTSRMNTLLREAVSKWWNDMTKDEILAYIADQPDITADHLRQILANEDFIMSFGVNFTASSSNAEADFHNA